MYADRTVLAAFPDRPAHPLAEVAREPGGVFVHCPTCDAQWAVHPSTAGPTFEEISAGDGFCVDRLRRMETDG